MIIDANVHITAHGKWFHTPHDASLDRLKREVEEAGIDMAIVVPLPGLIPNDEQRRMIGNNPRMLSAATFNPADYNSAKEAADAFVREFADRPSPFVKFHNRFGKYHAEDERFMAVIDANNKLEEPLVIGVCGLINDRNTGAAVQVEEYFFNLAKRMDRSKLIIMHGGGSRILQVAEMCRDLHNVFFDLSMTLTKYAQTSVSGDISWLCHHYDKRMIWASDFPETTIKQALTDFHNCVGAISDEKRDNILGENIRKLLNL